MLFLGWMFAGQKGLLKYYAFFFKRIPIEKIHVIQLDISQQFLNVPTPMGVGQRHCRKTSGFDRTLQNQHTGCITPA